MSSSAVNSCHYGNIFSFVQPALDREIQGLSFIVWCAVEILCCTLVLCMLCNILKLAIGIANLIKLSGIPHIYRHGKFKNV